MNEQPTAGATPAANVMVFLAADGVGRGEDDLGQALMQAFLRALGEVRPRPRTVAFMNAGVRLAAVGAPGLAALAALEAAGTELLLCGTCVEYFGLADKLGIGRVSNMAEITRRMIAADRVIRP